MANKTAKNLLQSTDTYNAYYGDFRGVDFSSDHSQVHPSRLAYAVNMYKDYQAGQGGGIETIPGFRRVACLPNGEKIHAIHRFVIDEKEVVLLHAGKHLYHWANFPEPIGVNVSETLVMKDGEELSDGIRKYTVRLEAEQVISVKKANGELLENGLWRLLFAPSRLVLESSEISDGDPITVTYLRKNFGIHELVFEDMNEKKSVSFALGDRGYILDGKNYLYCRFNQNVINVFSESLFLFCI